MSEFVIGYEAQTLPSWLAQAIAAGTVTVKGDSVSDIQYYTVNGVTAGPEQRLVFDGTSITVQG